MLEAVHTIHEARIVHGDLKPANFVYVGVCNALRDREETLIHFSKGIMKLIDFGIAKALGNDTTNIVRENQVIII
jgi:serine/threonine-protein kinase TTK/MPS1